MTKDYTITRKGADKFELYQWAVQDADDVVDFTMEQYMRLRQKKPQFLREDFCGTGLVASRWVDGHPKRQAIGLDLDRPTLDWAEEHNLSRLGKSRSQIELRECDVRTITSPKADVVQAFNFSYFLFYEIKDLIEYFRSVRASLAADGVFLLDCFGGWESQQPHIERRLVETPQGTFGFAWEIKSFNPIEQRAQCRIHFEFRKGKRWKNAFKYDFRIYSLPEISDALKTAGFANIEVLWDVGADDDSGDYRPTRRVENWPSWIAYVVATGTAI